MAETERLVRFHLLGQDFSFYTGASEEEMAAILALVKKQVEENGGRADRSIPVSKVAVMACLNIASHYLRLKHEYDDYRRGTEERLRLFNEKLATVLPAENKQG